MKKLCSFEKLPSTHTQTERKKTSKEYYFPWSSRYKWFPTSHSFPSSNAFHIYFCFRLDSKSEKHPFNAQELETNFDLNSLSISFFYLEWNLNFTTITVIVSHYCSLHQKIHVYNFALFFLILFFRSTLAMNIIHKLKWFYCKNCILLEKFEKLKLSYHAECIFHFCLKTKHEKLNTFKRHSHTKYRRARRKFFCFRNFC